MAPKRKRAADSNAGRPAPHRPGDTNLGQHDRGRAGSGGKPPRRNDRRDSGPFPSAPAAPSPLNSPSLARPSSASSQTVVAPLNTNVPSTHSSAPPSPIQSGYHYDVVTDARLGSWTQGGRQELVDHGIQSRDDEDVQELSTIFQELLQSCLDLRLKASQAGEVVKDIVGHRPEDADTNSRTFDPHTLFLDTISVYLDVDIGHADSNLRDFMVATGVDPALMRRVLEPPVLEQLGLIRDTFNRMGIRQATNILYKQANYNLLREETEGYAKLATELFTTCMNQAPSSDAIQASFERVKGLIGTFDLDVGRVLDVLLDVFASVLIKQNKFFVKFLRISSWWPSSNGTPSVFVGGLPKWALPESKHWQTSEEDERALCIQRLHRDAGFWTRAREVHLNAYFELGGRQLRPSDLQRIQTVLDANDGSAEDLSYLDPETQWIVATKTLPPQGNRVAAQLLGFKLRYYESDLLDPDEVIPANLFYMTALLIKIGFISLADLWPHLAPEDSKMQDYRAEREKILAEEERKKAGKGANALTMSMLPDDTKGEHKVTTNLEEKAVDAADNKKNGQEVQPQKVLLLAELLTMGAIPEALYILTRYDWLPEVYPDLIKLINRLLAHSIQKVFEETMGGIRDSGAPLDIPSKRLPDMDQTGAAKGSVKLGQLQQRRPLRWPHPDGETNNTAYRYYWDEWADNIPACQTVDDVFTLCDTLMNLSGVNIGKDPALLTKLAGIGAMSLAQDQSSSNMDRWQGLLTRLLVPALSLTNANSFAVQAVWDLLKLFPITTRYAIYSEWFLGRTSRLPSIRSAFARTRSETNSSLKRLSLTNLSAMAKKLAKTAYSSPGVVFKTAFDQIEAYPNLIQAFVECARYFTDLGYDVLTWSLMSALGGKSRSRTQEASVLLTSKWLQALSKFSGRVFKRYQNMKPAPVLQYVNSQLSRGNSTDLVILRELILSMAGVVSDLDFTDAQMRSMTGGEVLRRQTLIQLGDRRFESISGAKRLMQSLVDTKLAGRLLINLAQYRQSALYQDDAHVKYLATIMDEIQQALAQYLDLLRSNLTPDQFDTLIPGIAELMTAYGLDVNLAFMIGRASLAHRMASTKAAVLSPAKDARSNVQPTSGVADVDGDLAMNGTAADSTTNEQSLAKDEDGVKMVLDDKPAEEASLPATAETRKPDPIADVLQPLVDTIQDMLPSDTWRNLSPEFYVTFWSLTLGDLHVPQASYEAEHDRLYKESNDVMKDRSDMTRQGMNRKEEKKASLQALAKSIREEMSAHIERYQKTKFRLARQSKSWFSGPTAVVSAVADDLLAHCILPRLLMSTSDTEYCFRLMKFLHENQTPNFKLFALYEQFFNANRLRVLVFSATVHEADYLGRFIRCILEDLARWHADKNVYEKEAFGVKRKYLGFATAFDEEGNPTSFVEHPFFRDAHYEWHKNLNIALKACLQGTREWMHIRNALTVLKYVSDFFPAVNFMGSQLVRVLDDIKTREAASKDASDEEEHRVDLSVAAQTIFALLKRRESKWVSVQAFRPNMVSSSTVLQQKAAATNTRKSGMPQDGPKDVEMTAQVANNALRPTAPEFKPKQAATSVTPNGSPKQPVETKPLTQGSAPISTQPIEVEDGEVKDGKELKSLLAPDHNEHSKATPASSKSVVQDIGAAKEPANKDKAPVLTSRPATPKPIIAVAATASSSTGRNDNSRPSGTRLPHSLPSRPDVPIPGYSRRNPVPDDRRDLPRDNREQVQPREPREPRELRERHRDPRDVSREAREPRDHRQQDNSRGDRRDHHDADRRASDNVPREPGRLSERDWASRPEPIPRRNEHPADRDARSGRDRGQTFGRDSRGPREQPALVPVSQPAAPIPAAEEPPMNPQRAALFQEDDRGEIVNPQRAALMQNAPGHPPTRSPRDSGRDRTSSRTSSPRRDDRPHPGGPSGNHGREERHTRRNAESVQPPAREGDNPRDSDRPSSDRGRDTPHQGLPSRPQDTERNRSSQQDPNYGRLNPIPSITDTVPQGPREGPRGRGARNSTKPSSTPTAPRSDGRMLPPDALRAPSPDRQPPTGPSSSRARRGQPNQLDQAQATGGPTVHVPNTGMHPDRIRQFESSPSQVPIHPDRMSAIAPVPPPPPPPGPPPSRSRPNVPPIHTNDRAPTPTGPSGPRHGHGSLPNTPVTEQNAPYAVPTGPAAAHDRQRGSARRHLENLQNSITPNRRDSGYRGQRASVPDSDAQVLTGGSPISTPVSERPDPMRRNPVTERPHFGNDSNDLQNREPSRPGPAGEEFPSSRAEHDRSGRRDHRERSDRSGRHGGRERSPHGERDVRDPRGSEPHERHDRRPGPPPGMDPRDPNHEPIQPRRSTRDLAANSSARDPLPGGFREPPTSGREPRHRNDGRGENSRGDNNRGGIGRGDGGNGGRLTDDWGGGGRGSLRGAPRDGSRDAVPGRLGEDRRDPRGEERTSSRKRRSDVSELPPGDRDKRPRR